MVEDRDGLLQHYRRTPEALLSAIDGLSDEQLSEPSLDGWSVKDHLAHLALWDDVRASELARISAGYDSVWRMSEEQDQGYNAIGHELRLGMLSAQAKWELAGSRQRLLDPSSAATPRGLDPSLFDEAGLRSERDAEHAGWIKRWRGEKRI